MPGSNGAQSPDSTSHITAPAPLTRRRRRSRPRRRYGRWDFGGGAAHDACNSGDDPWGGAGSPPARPRGRPRTRPRSSWSAGITRHGGGSYPALCCQCVVDYLMVLLCPRVRRRRWSLVAQLLIPVHRAALRRQVEQIPQRLEGADASVVLSRVGWGVDELRPPEMTNRLALAVQYIEHLFLPSVLVLTEVVAVIRGAGRGEQSQVPPAALVSEGAKARRGGLRDDGKVEPLADMPRGAVELIQHGASVADRLTCPPPPSARGDDAACLRPLGVVLELFLVQSRHICPCLGIDLLDRRRTASEADVDARSLAT